MKHELPVEPHIIDVVATLQQANYEAYIVGGAIRDLLLGRRPKDYDISTSATPEQVREVFGRRNARIIGKRFRLVHLRLRDEIIEISTFRRAPNAAGSAGGRAGGRGTELLPEHMILSDNDYGTAEEDAWRRDFTVNALFFDPVRSELIDHTGQGREDIERGVVRAIGDPRLRFEEDPVRLLRALKLVGQYDFSLDAETENALFASLPLIRHASSSRLSLELEKVLSSSYGDKHLRAFHDYGFLTYFLPHLEERWGTPEMEYALELLTERNYRVDEGMYRNSISLAMATLALPFVEQAATGAVGELWPKKHALHRIREVLEVIFLPQNMMKCMQQSAERILELQPLLKMMSPEDRDIREARSYSHARELAVIQNIVRWHDPELEGFWPPDGTGGRTGRKRRKHRGRREKKAKGIDLSVSEVQE